MAKATAPKKEFNLLKRIAETSRSATSMETSFIPTYSPRLNWVLGGGIARNHITTFAGPAHTGKTTLALSIAQYVQHNASAMPNGGKTLYVCFEKFVPEWGRRLKISPDSFISYNPTHGEAALDVVLGAVRNKSVDFVIWDTVSNTPFRAEKEASQEDNVMLAGPKRWTGFLKVLNSDLDDSNVAFLALNHIKVQIGGYGTYEPGGECWTTVPSVKLQLLAPDNDDKTGDNKNIETRTGRTKVTFRYQTYVKNRFAPVARYGETEMYVGDQYKPYIDPMPDLVHLGVQFGLIEKGGAWYSYNGVKMQGSEALCRYLADNYEVAMTLGDQVHAKTIQTSEQEKEVEKPHVEDFPQTIELSDLDDLPSDFIHAGNFGE